MGNLSTTLGIIHAKVHKSRVSILAIKSEYPKKYEIGFLYIYPKKYEYGYPGIQIVEDTLSQTMAVKPGQTRLHTETGTGNYI